jgi:Putative regulator of cell autolysis
MERITIRPLIIILAICTLATIVYTSHLYLYHLISGEETSLLQDLAESASDWYSWAFLAPLMISLAARFPFLKRNWLVASLIHIPAALAFSFIQIVLHAFFDQLLIHHVFSQQAITETATHFFARTFHFGLLVYLLVIFAQNLTEYYKEQAVHASEMEARLTQAQLNSLKMQLQPHFLFNTLHAISALIKEDPQTAESMLARLSELLRFSLRSGNLQEVPLREEMKILDLYLDIERMRFHDRLTILTEIEAQAMSAYVPNLILQPLVENSIRHGISKHLGVGVITIRAKKMNDSLMMIVQDNGKGIPAQIREGVGLSTTRARLQQLYGSRHLFEMTSGEQKGVVVSIRIPYREEVANT